MTNQQTRSARWTRETLPSKISAPVGRDSHFLLSLPQERSTLRRRAQAQKEKRRKRLEKEKRRKRLEKEQVLMKSCPT